MPVRPSQQLEALHPPVESPQIPKMAISACSSPAPDGEMVKSTWRVASCHDNTAMDSFFNLLQENILNRRRSYKACAKLASAYRLSAPEVIVNMSSEFLTSRDKELVRDSLVELSRALRVLLLTGMGAPSSDSTAAFWQKSKFNSSSEFGPPLFISAGNTMALAVVAGASNVEAFVMLVEKGRGGTAAAPVTRAALEAYARAFFLLEADSDAVFYHRYLSLTHDELKYPVRHSKFINASGEEIDGLAYRQELGAIIKQLHFNNFLDVGLANLVGSLLAKSLEEPDIEPAIYSQLSGVAHAASSALAMFLETTSTGWQLKLPRDVALEYCGYLFAAIVKVAELAVVVFGPTGGVIDRWNAAKERAKIALAEL